MEKRKILILILTALFFTGFAGAEETLYQQGAASPGTEVTAADIMRKLSEIENRLADFEQKEKSSDEKIEELNKMVQKIQKTFAKTLVLGDSSI